jgi:hypothetical protein
MDDSAQSLRSVLYGMSKTLSHPMETLISQATVNGLSRGLGQGDNTALGVRRAGRASPSGSDIDCSSFRVDCETIRTAQCFACWRQIPGIDHCGNSGITDINKTEFAILGRACN